MSIFVKAAGLGDVETVQSTTTTTTIITQEMIHLWWTSPVSNGWLWQEDCTVHSQ